MQSKKCKKCDEVKTLTDYSKATTKDGFNTTCKACKSEYTRQHGRTIAGRVTAILGYQVRSSKDRGHTPPSYTKAELHTWLLLNGIEDLMVPWKASGYQKNLTPSVDRLDDSKGYTMENIQLVTWGENNEKMYTQRLTGDRVTKQNRLVTQYTLEGERIAEFNSIALAARVTGIQRTNINACCTGRDHQAGGFFWAYT